MGDRRFRPCRKGSQRQLPSRRHYITGNGPNRARFLGGRSLSSDIKNPPREARSPGSHTHPIALMPTSRFRHARFPQPSVVLRIPTRPNPRYHGSFLYDNAHHTIGRLPRGTKSSARTFRAHHSPLACPEETQPRRRVTHQHFSNRKCAIRIPRNPNKTKHRHQV
jgi:hypothetical protein